MKSVPIGLSNLVYAIMTSDTPPTTFGGNDGITTYDSAVRVVGAITANFSPNASNDTLFADDGPYETASTLGAMTLELNIADLPPAQRAELLGAQYDEETGILTHSADDVPPYVAVGMAIKKSNGHSRLVWYLKGKFTAPDDNNQTKADSINWNTPTITGNFLKRDSDNAWRFAVDTDDPNVAADIEDTWFNSPNVKALLDRVAAPVPVPPSGELDLSDISYITVTCDTEAAELEYKFGTESEWNEYEEPGIDTSELEAGSVVVLNLRAKKEGMATTYVNVNYSVVE